MLISELFIRMAVDASGVKKGVAEAQGSIARGVGAMTKSLGALGLGFTAAAFLRSVIKNSIEAQASLAQLNAVITSTGGAAGRSAGDLTAQADALSKVTAFGDDAIVSAQALLLTFTKIQGTTFDRATETVLDLATAMGGGEGGLKSASIQVGKALNDPIKGITALTKVGVSFTDAQKDMIKRLVETGDVAGAQAVILRELQTEFGGSARAARDTLGGALQGLSNAWGDALEVSGEASSGIVGAINGITAALPGMRSAVDTAFTELATRFRELRIHALESQADLNEWLAKLPWNRGDTAKGLRELADQFRIAADAGKAFMGPMLASGSGKKTLLQTTEEQASETAAQVKAVTKATEDYWETVDALTEQAEQNAIRQTQLMWDEAGREADRVNNLRTLYQQNVMDYGLALAEKANLASLHMLGMVDDIADSLEPAKGHLAQFEGAASGIAMRALDDFAAFAVGAGDSVAEFVDRAIKDLTRLLVKMAIIEGLNLLFPGSKFVGRITGALEGRAAGGPVQAGQAYRVGERGPEMFVPSSSGSIVPNGGGGALLSQLPPLERPMTPREAARDAWWRDFARELVTANERRG